MILPEAIAELVMANRIVAHLKVVDFFGHVTMRHPQNPERYLMSRSRAPGSVSAGDILEFHLDSTPVDSRGMSMYLERPIHGNIYQARPDVMAVCHNHAQGLLPFAVTKTAMRPAIHAAAVIGAEVPVWDIRDEFGETSLLVVNNDMGRSLARCLGQGRAALMRGHGSIVTGKSLKDVVFTAHYLQVNAEVVLRGRILGTVQSLSPEEVKLGAAVHDNPSLLGRAWEQWVVEAGLTGVV